MQQQPRNLGGAAGGDGGHATAAEDNHNSASTTTQHLRVGIATLVPLDLIYVRNELTGLYLSIGCPPPVLNNDTTATAPTPTTTQQQHRGANTKKGVPLGKHKRQQQPRRTTSSSSNREELLRNMVLRAGSLLTRIHPHSLAGSQMHHWERHKHHQNQEAPTIHQRDAASHKHNIQESGDDVEGISQAKTLLQLWLPVRLASYQICIIPALAVPDVLKLLPESLCNAIRPLLRWAFRKRLVLLPNGKMCIMNVDANAAAAARTEEKNDQQQLDVLVNSSAAASEKKAPAACLVLRSSIACCGEIACEQRRLRENRVHASGLAAAAVGIVCRRSHIEAVAAAGKTRNRSDFAGQWRVVSQYDFIMEALAPTMQRVLMRAASPFPATVFSVTPAGQQQQQSIAAASAPLSSRAVNGSARPEAEAAASPRQRSKHLSLVMASAFTYDHIINVVCKDVRVCRGVRAKQRVRIAAWRPQCPSGYVRFGDCLVVMKVAARSDDLDETALLQQPAFSTLIARDDPGIFSAPVRYELIGSCRDRDRVAKREKRFLHVWRPVSSSPEHVALGVVFTADAPASKYPLQPSLRTNVRCVSKRALCTAPRDLCAPTDLMACLPCVLPRSAGDRHKEVSKKKHSLRVWQVAPTGLNTALVTVNAAYDDLLLNEEQTGGAGDAFVSSDSYFVLRATVSHSGASNSGAASTVSSATADSLLHELPMGGGDMLQAALSNPLGIDGNLDLEGAPTPLTSPVDDLSDDLPLPDVLSISGAGVMLDTPLSDDNDSSEEGSLSSCLNESKACDGASSGANEIARLVIPGADDMFRPMSSTNSPSTASPSLSMTMPSTQPTSDATVRTGVPDSDSRDDSVASSGTRGGLCAPSTSQWPRGHPFIDALSVLAHISNDSGHMFGHKSLSDRVRVLVCQDNDCDVLKSNSEMRYKDVSLNITYEYIWDSSSHVDRTKRVPSDGAIRGQFSVWRSSLPEGFVRFGDYICAGLGEYNNKERSIQPKPVYATNGSRMVGGGIMMDMPGVFVAPTGYKLVWQVRGKRPLFVWQPVSPCDSHMALGCVCTTTHGQPDVYAVRCVPLSMLSTTPWNDRVWCSSREFEQRVKGDGFVYSSVRNSHGKKSSKARYKASLWRSPDLGTFCVSTGSHGEPVDTVCYVIRVKKSHASEEASLRTLIEDVALSLTDAVCYAIRLMTLGLERKTQVKSTHQSVLTATGKSPTITAVTGGSIDDMLSLESYRQSTSMFTSVALLCSFLREGLKGLVESEFEQTRAVFQPIVDMWLNGLRRVEAEMNQCTRRITSVVLYDLRTASSNHGLPASSEDGERLHSACVLIDSLPCDVKGGIIEFVCRQVLRPYCCTFEGVDRAFSAATATIGEGDSSDSSSAGCVSRAASRLPVGKRERGLVKVFKRTTRPRSHSHVPGDTEDGKAPLTADVTTAQRARFDGIVRLRVAWLQRMLDAKRKQLRNIFPDSWHVELHIIREWCCITAADLAALLSTFVKVGSDGMMGAATSLQTTQSTLAFDLQVVASLRILAQVENSCMEQVSKQLSVSEKDDNGEAISPVFCFRGCVISVFRPFVGSAALLEQEFAAGIEFTTSIDIISELNHASRHVVKRLPSVEALCARLHKGVLRCRELKDGLAADVVYDAIRAGLARYIRTLRKTVLRIDASLGGDIQGSGTARRAISFRRLTRRDATCCCIMINTAQYMITKIPDLRRYCVSVFPPDGVNPNAVDHGTDEVGISGVASASLIQSDGSAVSTTAGAASDFGRGVRSGSKSSTIPHEPLYPGALDLAQELDQLTGLIDRSITLIVRDAVMRIRSVLLSLSETDWSAWNVRRRERRRRQLATAAAAASNVVAGGMSYEIDTRVHVDDDFSDDDDTTDTSASVQKRGKTEVSLASSPYIVAILGILQWDNDADTDTARRMVSSDVHHERAASDPRAPSVSLGSMFSRFVSRPTRPRIPVAPLGSNEHNDGGLSTDWTKNSSDSSVKGETNRGGAGDGNVGERELVVEPEDPQDPAFWWYAGRNLSIGQVCRTLCATVSAAYVRTFAVKLISRVLRLYAAAIYRCTHIGCRGARLLLNDVRHIKARLLSLSTFLVRVAAANVNASQSGCAVVTAKDAEGKEGGVQPNVHVRLMSRVVTRCVDRETKRLDCVLRCCAARTIPSLVRIFTQSFPNGRVGHLRLIMAIKGVTSAQQLRAEDLFSAMEKSRQHAAIDGDQISLDLLNSSGAERRNLHVNVVSSSSDVSNRNCDGVLGASRQHSGRLTPPNPVNLFGEVPHASSTAAGETGRSKQHPHGAVYSQRRFVRNDEALANSSSTDMEAHRSRDREVRRLRLKERRRHRHSDAGNMFLRSLKSLF